MVKGFLRISAPLRKEGAILLCSRLRSEVSGRRKTLLGIISILPAFAVLVMVISCSAGESSLSVFAAAGAKLPLDEIGQMFEEKYGTAVDISYGGGGEVLNQMVLSRTGDIYVAPEQGFMEKAREKQVIDPETIRSVAYMIPVIGVQKGNPRNIQSLADLAGPGIKVVMGNPETTLLGQLVPDMLQKAGLYDAVKRNIVTNAPQVTAMITMLKMNQVDAGVIWHYFGTTAPNDVDIIWIPREHVTGVGEIQAAVSLYSQEEKTAQKFIDLLASSEGKEIFKKNGYITDAREVSQCCQ